jgi:hypothetical protein
LWIVFTNLFRFAGIFVKKILRILSGTFKVNITKIEFQIADFSELKSRIPIDVGCLFGQVPNGITTLSVAVFLVINRVELLNLLTIWSIIKTF